MEKVLIEASSSYEAAEKAEKYFSECGKIRHVTIFFESSNFLITKYEMLSAWVHMVLEFDDLEIQIESLNCGYVGAGPNCAIRLLKRLGLPEMQLTPLIHENHAISFRVLGGEIHELNTYQLFYDVEPICYKNNALRNKIHGNENVDIDLQEKLIRFYNPQRTNWMGFLNLLNYMENIEFEYYIGEKSLLDRGLYIGSGGFRNGIKDKDIKGTVHCNLYLTGANFNVSCLIDREYEVEVIEAVYLALTGKRLVIQNVGKQNWITQLFHRGEKMELTDRIVINRMKRE